MKITEVKIRRLTQDDKLKAIVSVTLDEVFAVHDIKVIQGNQGLFVAMPSRRAHDGTYRDIVHPIQMEFRSRMTDAILEEYRSALSEQEDTETASRMPVFSS